MSLTMKKWSLLILSLLLGAALLVPLAVASGSEAQQIANLRAELERLSESDQGGAGKEEIQRARGWLDEAERFLGERSHRQAEYRLRRADHTVDLIRALVEVGNIEATTAQQQERYEEAQAEIARLQEEIMELETRKAERERQLRELRGR